ncbi:MAG: glycine cleavage system aminomethyltransferase GcvT [Schleiferiaceae bacterium]|nr:glycine cleavage system aminomethyltransferase GcvT [Schleiferiaceae bacterium]
MKSIPLENKHLEWKAKMAPFAGFNMPIQYDGLKLEHQLVREKVGMFDVSHMGEFRVTGQQALPFLQKVTTNDVSRLQPGKIQYTCMPTPEGGIVDDLLIYQLAENEYFLVVNAANLEKDFNWLEAHRPEGAFLRDESDDWCLLAVQGPEAEAVLQKLTEVNLSEVPFYTFTRGALGGSPELIISATGYTGEAGFELYVPAQDAPTVWEAVLEAGAPHGLRPVGLGARDTLRLEAGLCLYGNDIDHSTSPIEARLGWITKLEKGDFLGRDIFARQKEEGVQRRLVGFELTERGIPRQGYRLLNAEGQPIGEVTSGTQSPTLNKPIGLGYAQKGYTKPGTDIFVEIRQKQVPAQIVKLPFYKR